MFNDRSSCMQGADGSYITKIATKITELSSSSKCKLNVDILYPYATLQYKLPIYLKVFIKDMRKMLFNTSTKVEDKLKEAGNVQDLLQARRATTPGFVLDAINDQLIEFYTAEYKAAFVDISPECKDLKDLRYCMSICGAWCIRNNPKMSLQVVQNMLDIIESDVYDEQTKMEFADCLELNANAYPSFQARAIAYIDSVVKEKRVRRSPIKGNMKNLAIYEAVTAGVKDIKSPGVLDRFVQGIKNRLHSLMKPTSTNEVELEEMKQPYKDEEDDKHIYSSTQNVHKNKISNVIYDKLQQLEDQVEIQESITFDVVADEFIQEVKMNKFIVEEHDFKVLYQALARISTDPSVFAPTSLKLKDVFMKVHARIGTSENYVELLKRLVEELLDTAEFCASGYCSRIVNVLSGFEDVDFEVGVNDKLIVDEMFEYCKVRLQAAIADIDNPDLQSMIINGLSDNSLVAKAFIKEQIPLWQHQVHQDYPGLDVDIIDKAMSKAVKKFVV